MGLVDSGKMIDSEATPRAGAARISGGHGVLAGLVGLLLALAGGALSAEAGPARSGAASGSGPRDGSGAAGGGPVRLAVPAYWSAGTSAGAADFDRLIADAPTVDTVIVNGWDSGPAVPFDPALAAAIARLHAAGITVLGYVDTGYLGRTGVATSRVAAGSTAIADWRTQADADAAAWQEHYSGYGLSGIFFDQTLSACGVDHKYVDTYGEITAGVWRRQPDAVVAINPGTAVEECYTVVTDIIVVVEESMAAYRAWTPPEWVSAHPTTMFWHLVHAAPTPEVMREAVALARARHAGYVYVTDAVTDGAGGPWHALPAHEYWAEEVAIAQATRSECEWQRYPR